MYGTHGARVKALAVAKVVVARARRDALQRRVMEWIWPIYEEHVGRLTGEGADDRTNQATFMRSLAESTVTLYVMEPMGNTIRFKGLARWPLTEIPDFVGDPNAFIADRYGGGKFKTNFHHGFTFVGTHNFRTWGDPVWEQCDEVNFD